MVGIKFDTQIRPGDDDLQNVAVVSGDHGELRVVEGLGIAVDPQLLVVPAELELDGGSVVGAAFQIQAIQIELHHIGGKVDAGDKIVGQLAVGDLGGEVEGGLVG